MKLKICVICKEEKENTQFYKDKSKLDGFRNRCKSCDSVIHKEYRKNNKEVMYKSKRKWYDNNRERAKESYKLWYAKNKDILNAKKRNNRNDDPIKYIVQNIKSRSKTLNIPFNITEEYVKKLWTGVCPIFNINIELNREKGKEYSAELDRFNPNKGYVKGNVEWISRRANRIKSNSSLKELEKIVNWMKGKDND